jgi:hypothetical protein
MTKVAGYYPVEAIVAEMTGAKQAADELIQLDAELVKAVVGDDPNPMFVTIEVLNESVSTNGRFYDRETIIDIARQINEKHPDGYKGHLTDAERDHKVPDAETIWLGARVIDDQGKARLIAKGYVLPEARSRRSILKRASAIKRNVAVSIYGTSRVVRDAAKKALRVFDFDLESVDWTRPGSEGVRNSGIFAVTAEMSSGKNNEGEDMTLAEALASASAQDIKAHAKPEVVAEMTREAVEAEKASSRTVVSEMTSLKETLGDNPVQVVAEMQSQLTKFELEKELNTKVSDKAARKMVERMVVSEMKSDAALKPAEAVAKVLESEDGKAVIAEMTTREPVVTPQISQPGATAHKYLESKKEN